MSDAEAAEEAERRPLPYPLVCVLAGLPFAWAPVLLGWLFGPGYGHGPIPEKFDVLYIQGSIAIWSYYAARMLIGLWVGITAWPARWWLRGPLCGFLGVFPLTLVSLAMPGCGLPCMRINLATATLTGLAAAGIARLVTGKDRA